MGKCKHRGIAYKFIGLKCKVNVKNVVCCRVNEGKLTTGGGSEKLKNHNKPMSIYVHTYIFTEKLNSHEYTIFNFTLRDYLTQKNYT